MGEVLEYIWVGWDFGGTFGARSVSKDRAMVGLKIVLVGLWKMVILIYRSKQAANWLLFDTPTQVYGAFVFKNMRYDNRRFERNDSISPR